MLVEWLVLVLSQLLSQLPLRRAVALLVRTTQLAFPIRFCSAKPLQLELDRAYRGRSQFWPPSLRHLLREQRLMACARNHVRRVGLLPLQQAFLPVCPTRAKMVALVSTVWMARIRARAR